MKKWLAPMFAVALVALGCDDEETVIRYDGGGASDGGGGTGGVGGAGGAGARDAGIDAAAGTGGTPGDGGIRDGSADVSTNPDAVSGTWAMCSGGQKPGVSAQEFCDYYEATCGTLYGGTNFTSKADCIAKYPMFAAGDTMKGQACVAYHLCVAGTDKRGGQGSWMAHCGHAAGNAPCAKN